MSCTIWIVFFLFFFLVSILIVAAWVKFNISKKTLVETNILVYSQMYRPVVIIQVWQVTF